MNAALAVNILKYGIPRGDDGINRLVFNSPLDLNKDSVWVYSPWLSLYITAASFAIFGENEFAARLPFAVFGFLSVMFLFYLVWDIFKDRQMALITLLLSVTSEVLILHSRQCRYYSVAIFMQVLFIFAFYLLIKRKRAGIVLIVISLTCQFYNNYMFVPGNIMLLLFAGFMLRKKYHGEFKDSIIAAVTVSLFALIWVIYARLWSQTIYVGGNSFYQKLLFYLMEINMTMFPLLILLPFVFFRKNDYVISDISRDMIIFTICIIPFQLVILVNFQVTIIRYIIVLVPVFIVLLAFVLRRITPVLRYSLLGIICATNIAGYAGMFIFKAIEPTGSRFEYQRPRITIKDIFMERITPYVNRSEELIAFLKENVRPGQTLLVCEPEFPLIFYTNLKVLDFHYYADSGLTEIPDWIIPQSISGLVVGGKTFSIEGNLEFLQQNYDKIILEVHNSKIGGSITDPDLYEYFTPPDKTQFIIFKKKTLPAAGKHI
ncbi:MAG: glycosyltransferase family 39 protein [Nitrospirae bacterium]|nr:glycosyltransferase family 39 protein [Nitrospirota bacterium]